MGRADTALAVQNYIKNHPGKDISAKAIAKATGASSSGVVGILRRLIKAKEPILEGKKGKNLTFRYQPVNGEAGIVPAIPGEMTLSFPMANGHAVHLTLEQARKLYDQLKALFTTANPS